MLHNDPMPPGAVSHAATSGHNHAWEHVVFVLEGTATFVCEGKDYTVSQGDAMARTFESTETEELEARLLRAVEAGRDAGGQPEGQRSAALIV